MVKEFIKAYSQIVAHWAVAKVYLHFPSKWEDASIHLLEASISTKKCAKLVERKDIENKADLLINVMSEELGI